LRLAVLQCEPETGLGAFGGVLDAGGVKYDALDAQRALSPGDEFDGAIVLGGSLGADDVPLVTRRWLGESVRAGVPCFAVCLGAQLLAAALGARVIRGRPELGAHDIYLLDTALRDPLFAGLPRRVKVFSFHGDRFELPRPAVPLAGSLNCTYHAFRFGVAAYGFQFHPEVRREDLDSWRNVPGYRRLVDECNGDWNGLADELEHATPELDELATGFLNRWLDLTAAVTTLRERRQLAA